MLVATAIAIRPIAKVAAPDLVRDLDLTDDEVLYLLDLAAKVKRTPAKYARALSGKYISLLFEKPSLRTRLTFELAIKQLGGDAVTSEGPLGIREPLKDVARNLERWMQAIVARTFSQSTIEELARWSTAPVINALSDLYHPCQALADVLTLREQFGELRGLKLAFAGDGNNVAHSLMLTAVRLGIDFAVATPEGYAPNAEIVTDA
jgi:ornithine carbamoyltransferase